jgi:hypothetical protein
MESIKWKISDARHEELMQEFFNGRPSYSSEGVARWTEGLTRTFSGTTSTLVGSTTPRTATRSCISESTFGGAWTPSTAVRTTELPTIQESDMIHEVDSRSNRCSQHFDISQPTQSPSPLVELDSENSQHRLNELESEYYAMEMERSIGPSELDGSPTCFELPIRPCTPISTISSCSTVSPRSSLEDLTLNEPIGPDVIFIADSNISRQNTTISVRKSQILAKNQSPERFNGLESPLCQTPCFLNRNRPKRRSRKRTSRIPKAKGSANTKSAELIDKSISKQETETKVEISPDLSQSPDGIYGKEVSLSHLLATETSANDNSEAPSDGQDQQTTKQEGSRNGESSGNSSGTESSQRSISKERRGLGRNNGSQEPEESDDGSGRKRKRQRKRKDPPTKRKFACLYHKYDPRMYSIAGDQTYRICQLTGYDYISELL